MKDFQELVLEELRSLKEGQRRVDGRLTSVDGRLTSLEERQTRFEEKLDAVLEQTAVLTEFVTRGRG